VTRWTSEPEAAALALIVSALETLELGDSVLLAGGTHALSTHLQAAGRTIAHWNRRCASAAGATADPPDGTFSSALLRLPKSRDEQLMAVHQCLGALTPTGRLFVYGGNDEGVRSFQKTLADLGAVTTLAARGHGRVLELQRQDVNVPLKPRLAKWRTTSGDDWVSYPGLFAGGTPDPGTLLLLQHLPDFADDMSVLDYGCGPGAIAAAIRTRQPNAKLTLIDNDAVALVAAAENVPGAALLLGADLAAAGNARYSLIVSNPPLHTGFKEDLAPLNRFIEMAPAHLTERGALVMVVQRRIPLDRTLSQVFDAVETVADDGRYRIWRAHTPTRLKPTVPVPKRLR
jgi:16S rRNA (guanine1207-N2)-methyltransferase